MAKIRILFIILGGFLLPELTAAQAPALDVTYVRALQQKYPSVSSPLCAACKLWENPYFKSIADTAAHRPVVTYYVYTREHRLAQEALNIPRTGIPAAWSSGYGQPDETMIYRAANIESTDMIAKGHCQAWILLAWCLDAAILSDTYTFNAGMEFQGQNIGTELATEELCRKLTGFKGLAVTDSVQIWCGTSGAQHVYSQGALAVTMPEAYYKIICYKDLSTHQPVRLCYWLPNQPTESRAKLPQRIVDFSVLVKKLGFDPTIVLH
ncbi:DNA/RNA non-specific endonuclease [Mucilaginibacter gossypii]|uniref:DNA/RNA non-specific endonuclease/pyrophosphatase/phosphodiesterase domain-containing protein n=1 Tax=Mucilaginibacter gossypii TaxID=551996 RepID=A0A1G8NKB1_9SPHI|nr:DNA/RNA non-specific endonuclease [Mucilaginibacter gossypii]SDI80466.1 hypothetical protein SAMN05192573_1346 [Mucilaginibacter gossypii]